MAQRPQCVAFRRTTRVVNYPRRLRYRYSDTHAEPGPGRDTYSMTQAEPPINNPTYVPYRADLESPRADEQQLIENIIASLRKNNEKAFKKYKHGIRDAHAKSHGILRGQLSLPDFPSTWRRASSRPGHLRHRFAALHHRRRAPQRSGSRCTWLGDQGSRRAREPTAQGRHRHHFRISSSSTSPGFRSRTPCTTRRAECGWQGPCPSCPTSG